MLLQKQYSLMNLLNKFVGLVIVIMGILYVFFTFRASLIESNINKQNVEITKINAQIKELNETSYLQKLNLASVIMEKENITNYYALYTYLFKLKESLSKALAKVGIQNNAFKLEISKDSVNIDMMSPDYDTVYKNKSGIIDILTKKPFVKDMSISSFAKDNGFIKFKVQLKTK